MRLEPLLFVSIWLAYPAAAHRESAAAALNAQVPSDGPPLRTHLEMKKSFADSGISANIMKENKMETAGVRLGMIAQNVAKKTTEATVHMKNLADNAPPINAESLKNGAGEAIGMAAQSALGKTVQATVHVKNLADNAPPINAETLKKGASEAGNWVRENPGKAALVAGSVTVIAAPALVASPALAAVGFGVPGPVGGGFAASVQSGMGSVVAPSVFSTCQSAAMGGYGVAAVHGVVQGTAAVVGTAAAGIDWLRARL